MGKPYQCLDRQLRGPRDTRCPRGPQDAAHQVRTGAAAAVKHRLRMTNKFNVSTSGNFDFGGRVSTAGLSFVCVFFFFCKM